MGRPRGYELDGASRVEIYILKGGRLFLIFYYSTWLMTVAEW